MRLSTIALVALLATGCAAPHDGTADSPAADAPATAASTPDAAGPAAEPTRTTVPAQFQGEYATDTRACNSPAHESRLTIGAWRIKFHESSGAIVAVESGRNALTITAELTGEGQTREATYRFNLSDDGQILTDRDSGMKRQRC